MNTIGTYLQSLFFTRDKKIEVIIEHNALASNFLTLAELKTSFLQSGKMLMDHGGRSYCLLK